MTEQTKKQLLEKPVVLYDGTCRVCTTAHDQLRELDQDGILEWMSIDDESAQKRFPNVDWDRAEKEIHIIHTDGRIRTGTRAVQDIAELVGGDIGKNVSKLMNVPGIKDASDLIYKLISENRHRLGKVNTTQS